MPKPALTPEPIETVACDLLRAHLEGDASARAEAYMEAARRGQLPDLVLCLTGLAIHYGQRAHGADLAEQLRHTTFHTLGLVPTPRTQTATAATDLRHPNQHGGTA